MRSFNKAVNNVKTFVSKYETNEFKARLAKEKILKGIDWSKAMRTTSHQFELETQPLMSLNCVFPSLSFSDCIMTFQYPCVEWGLNSASLGLSFKNLCNNLTEFDTYDQVTFAILDLESKLRGTKPKYSYGDLKIYVCEFLTSSSAMQFKHQDLIGTVNGEIVFIIGMPLCRTAKITRFAISRNKDKFVVYLVGDGESTVKSFRINLSDYSISFS